MRVNSSVTDATATRSSCISSLVFYYNCSENETASAYKNIELFRAAKQGNLKLATNLYIFKVSYLIDNQLTGPHTGTVQGHTHAHNYYRVSGGPQYPSLMGLKPSHAGRRFDTANH
jgi:hypothetical protein